MTLANQLKTVVSENKHNLRFLGIVIVILLTMSLVQFDTFVYLTENWTAWDQELSHGFLVIVLFLIMCFKTPPTSTVKMGYLTQALIFFLLTLLVTIWGIFQALSVNLIAALSLWPIFICLLTLTIGPRNIIRLLIPLLFLFFALPIWEYLNTSLVNLSSSVVTFFLDQIHITAYIEGNTITLPYGIIKIADGCSGLRYFVIAFALSIAIIWFNRLSAKQACSWIVLSILMGLISNWVRIFILVIIGYQSKMTSSLLEDHELFGWIVFAIAFFPIIYFAPYNKEEKKLDAAPIQLTYRSIIPLLAFCTLSLSLTNTISMEIYPSPPPTNPQELKSQVILNDVRKFDEYSQIDFFENGQHIQQFLFINKRNNQKEKLVPYISRAWSNDIYISKRLGNSNAYILKEIAGNNKFVLLQEFRIGNFITESYAVIKLYQILALLLKQDEFESIVLTTKCYSLDCEVELSSLTALLESYKKDFL